ncbi:hypothetical protein HPP92_022681 [Vanilla planifolia]|uniref:Uncharacterized protein n=1 Tax=Vanilla planifolia TaxID=51239 RepID=A0A835PV70_VANPL|nr:hypothetical protein HPP92_022681 [Vanilla planifolia]
MEASPRKKTTSVFRSIRALGAGQQPTNYSYRNRAFCFRCFSLTFPVCLIPHRWSIIASQLHGRTDNDVKNYWNSKLKKKILTAGETNTRHFAPDPTANFHFVSPSPPPPPQPQIPTIKSEAFLSSSLPPGCFDFNIPCILQSYQTPPILQQLPADVVAIGYNTPPVAEDASVGSAASSSVTTDNTGDASFLSELESSWTDLLLASFSEGGHQLPAAQEIGFLTNGEMI